MGNVRSYMVGIGIVASGAQCWYRKLFASALSISRRQTERDRLGASVVVYLLLLPTLQDVLISPCMDNTSYVLFTCYHPYRSL